LSLFCLFVLSRPEYLKKRAQTQNFGPFNGPTYQGLQRASKAAAVWQALNYNQTSLSWYSTLQVAEIFIEDMNPSFDTVSDSMPCQFFCTEERKKLIHTIGVLGQGRLRITNNPKNYTGMFTSGSDSLIIRMSLAKQPTSTGGVVEYLPGVVVKYFRDGIPSANSFVMYSLLGQNSYNFFKHDLSNHVPSFGDWVATPQQLLYQKFLTASSWPTMIGLSDMASFDQTGKNYSNPNFPYRLIFHPVTRWHNAFSDSDPGMGFNEQLVRTLTPGPLYEVYAQDQPLQDNSQLIHIGTLDLTTPSLSHYGDRSLFMQHTRFETDLALFPNWESGAAQDIQNQENTPPPGYTYPDLPWSTSAPKSSLRN